MHTVFIDGQAGTTGLQIQKRLQQRADLELVKIDPDQRKDPLAKKKIINQVDLVILCLPDDASVAAVKLIENDHTKVLDASTAFRVHEQWVYGLPELHPKRRNLIRKAKRVSNPGCYSTGFLLAVAPLIVDRLLPTETQVSINALSGYSGGGRNLIERYETRKKSHPDHLWHTRPYSLRLTHKHLPEMQKYAQLAHKPLFMPSVGHFYQGMLVTIPLFKEQLALSTSITNVHEVIADYYLDEPCVRVHPINDESALEGGYLDPEANNGTNRMDIFVFGNDQQMLLISRLDNLGKGASGAAVQNLNLMLGADELTGLEL